MENFGIAALKEAYKTDLLGSNFRLEILSWHPGAEMGTLVESDLAVKRELSSRGRVLGWPQAMLEAIEGAYCERFPSGLVASYAMALALFRIEEDNWFSFDRALKASAWFAEPAYQSARRELVLLKGVDASLAMPGLAFAPDLPLVLDHGEGSLSLILVGLAD